MQRKNRWWDEWTGVPGVPLLCFLPLWPWLLIKIGFLMIFCNTFILNLMNTDIRCKYFFLLIFFLHDGGNKSETIFFFWCRQHYYLNCSLCDVKEVKRCHITDNWQFKPHCHRDLVQSLNTHRVINTSNYHIVFVYVVYCIWLLWSNMVSSL